MNYTWEISKIIFYLIFVLGSIYLLAYLLRKKLQFQNENRHIEILEKMYLSPEVFLALIKVNEKVILLSITDNNIGKIESWDSEDFDEKELDKKEFKNYFQGLLNKKGISGYRRDKNEEK
ncbi:MAG: FliO/MopB family protein [Halanaerobiaceae bacterium]|nr:FliO/MopB family protein [Halanaerobiaceae bacterium]